MNPEIGDVIMCLYKEDNEYAKTFIEACSFMKKEKKEGETRGAFTSFVK